MYRTLRAVVLWWTAWQAGFVAAAESDIVFEDRFQGAIKSDWSWLREDPAAWRVTDDGLELRVQPGNMWGGANNAKNVMLRPLDVRPDASLEIEVEFENQPTEQYEQVDLVWYYADSHMVKIGQELVDGQLSIVMGREAEDRTRTIAIIPLKTKRVTVRFVVDGPTIQGYFRPAGEAAWTKAGQCDLPVKEGARPQVSIQAYQGPADVAHWARVRELRVTRPR